MFSLWHPAGNAKSLGDDEMEVESTWLTVNPGSPLRHREASLRSLSEGRGSLLPLSLVGATL